jgi:two-component system sensor histidine kinase MtrB
MATLTYGLARSYLLRQREASVLRQTFTNARLVRSGLRTERPDVPRLLASLETPAGSHPVLFYDGQWYAASVSTGREALPARLRSDVVGGEPARQRFRLRGTPAVAVGVPVRGVGASYFEIFSLQEMDRTLRVLRNALAAGAALTTLAGASIGLWAGRRLLRPVAATSEAAAEIAGGRLDVRLAPARDPDLATLAISFNQMTDALVERIAREARFAAAVSHELRTPLTTLSTSLEVLLARRSELPERARTGLDLLASEVRRFQRLVEDLLEISRIDAGATELSLEEVRLGEFVLHALDAEGKATLALDLDSSAVDTVVRVDKRRLERVLANLVENGDFYGGGVVRMAVERHDSVAQLAVEDAGPGVAEEDRERIFERFVRGRRGVRDGSSEGSGLGLSLVHEHVRLHGGRVWVEDRPGGGARFVVELPAVEP